MKRKRPKLLTDRLFFLIEYLSLSEATGDPEADWETHQIQFLNNDEVLTIDTKSRQVGWSFTAALDSVAQAVLVPRSTCIFVSVTKDEASEKIRYANHIIEALDTDIRPQKVIDNRTEIELDNGSRLISHPCRPPRGKARARVYLDEMAHYARDEEIYTAAMPIITRGGVIRIGSSPLGASGKFWEIYTEALRTYPGYQRRSIPWWVIAHLCKDVPMAKHIAPQMTTQERVKAFGTERLIAIYENMPIEDFQQEYECDWADESVAWIPWDEIQLNQQEALMGVLHCEMREVEVHNSSEAFNAIEEVASWIKSGLIVPQLHGGMDIGRQRNASEIAIIGKEGSFSSERYPLRLGLTLNRLPFEAQKEIVVRILETLPVDHFMIDRSGLGMQLAEDMETTYPSKVTGVDFTGQSKEEMAVVVKLRMQKGQCPIPLHRGFAYQIHSIKRMITPSKRLVFDTERNEKHHADKFWAYGLAHASVVSIQNIVVGRNPLAGYRG